MVLLGTVPSPGRDFNRQVIVSHPARGMSGVAYEALIDWLRSLQECHVNGYFIYEGESTQNA